jgi:hypothetical protein
LLPFSSSLTCTLISMQGLTIKNRFYIKHVKCTFI